MSGCQKLSNQELIARVKELYDELEGWLCMKGVDLEHSTFVVFGAALSECLRRLEEKEEKTEEVVEPDPLKSLSSLELVATYGAVSSQLKSSNLSNAKRRNLEDEYTSLGAQLIYRCSERDDLRRAIAAFMEALPKLSLPS